jgi:ribosome-binding factor A
LGETLREVLADELVRIDDERLEFVTVTRVEVDPEMNRGIVFFDSLAGEEGDALILQAFSDHRKRLQSSIGKQVRAKKTPILSFRPDEVIRSAERIEKILRENPSPSREATVNEDNYVQKKVFPEPEDVVEEEDDVEDADSEVNDLNGEA